VIRRFSRPWWISLASGSCLFGLLTYGVLRWLGAVSDDRLVLYLLLGIAVGDVLLALSFEVTSPTPITVGPGERRTASCAIDELVEVVAGFEDGVSGRVRIRGEIWNARTENGQPVRLQPGDAAKVIGRDGLTLLIVLSEKHE